MTGANSDLSSTYAIIGVFIKIAQFIVDLIVKLSNGEAIELPDFGTIFTK